MPGRWKDYFHFQKIERQGLILLIVLIVISLLLANLPTEKKNSPTDYTDFKQKIAEFEASLEIEEKQQKNKANPEKKPNELFYFDPNGLPLEDWVKLGLSPKQAKVIINYERNGGAFHKKEDLLKMYSVSEELYRQLENYIRIKNVGTKNKDSPREKYSSKPYKSSRPKNILLELNSADSAELQKLKGIGPAFSTRIVKYRQLLGGFVSKEQLMEVWGLDSSLYHSIAEFVYLEPNSSLIKINVNTASAKELAKHPYIDWNTANSIFKFRITHGDYKDLQGLRQSHLIDDTLYRKIVPYLSIE